MSRSESLGRLQAVFGVIAGLVANGFFAALWLVFGGAGAGNAGQGNQFMDAFTKASIGAFGGCLLLAVGLLISGKFRAAVLCAWVSGLLMFGAFAFLFY